MIRNYADIPSTNMVRPLIRGNLQLPAKKWEVFYRFEIFSNEYSKNFRQRNRVAKKAKKIILKFEKLGLVKAFDSLSFYYYDVSIFFAVSPRWYVLL